MTIRLADYVNAADISANDLPHTVVEKLQRAIDQSTWTCDDCPKWTGGACPRDCSFYRRKG